MMMTRLRLLFVPLLPLTAALAVLMAPSVRAEQQPAPPPTIDVSKLKTTEDQVVIPVPSEIFHALDNLVGSKNLNWSAQIAPESKFKPTNSAEIAMLLGTVIANGFIAVEAKDAGRVQEIGRRVIELASALSVQKAVVEHCNAIIQASEGGDWSGVRAELDKTQSSVRDAMEHLQSRDQAELVSIAGWLKGTETLSALINADYKADRADLLHQPDMLSTFETQFKKMEPKIQNNRKVKELRDGLQKIKPLIDGTISDKSVGQINQISIGLVKTIAP